MSSHISISHTLFNVFSAFCSEEEAKLLWELRAVGDLMDLSGIGRDVGAEVRDQEQMRNWILRADRFKSSNTLEINKIFTV